MSSISVIIPASNEATYIGDCLRSVLKQDFAGALQAVVVANGCHDNTAERARMLQSDFKLRGWSLTVKERSEGGKIGALNMGDSAAVHGHRLYLDADILMDRNMLSALTEALNAEDPRYAGGKLVVADAQSTITGYYARFWSRLPFMTRDVTGAGLFAVNSAGRERWDLFPQLISDDSYIRLLFTEKERIKVNSSYLWPMAEGFKRLVRVRRRQDLGVQEIARLYPELIDNQGTTRPNVKELATLAFRDPLGFLVYATVAVAVRASRNSESWARGR